MHEHAAFAKTWEEAWNSHDLNRIMAHYHRDITFRSAKAQILVGQGTLHGKEAPQSYWAKALNAQPGLRFQVNDLFAGHDMVVLTYLNHRNARAAETLRFDPDGFVIEASACHQID